MGRSTQKKDKVELITDKARNHPVLSWIIIIFIVTLAIVGFIKAAVEGYNFIKDGWNNITSEKPLSQEQVNEWARNQNKHEREINKIDKVSEIAQKTNSEIWLTYDAFLSSLNKTLKIYQKNDSSNIYIQIPNLPENLFNEDATKYRGGAIFSRNAAWSILYKDQLRNGIVIRVLELHFMDGDGTTKGGTGVGFIQIYFDVESRSIEVNSSGIGKIALHNFSDKFSVEDFNTICPTMIKLMLQFQLKHL